MNVYKRITTAAALIGATLTSHAAFVNEDFDDGVIDVFYTPIGDTAFVSDLGSSTLGAGALRLSNGPAPSPIFGGGINGLAAGLESIVSTLGSTFSLDFSALVGQLAPNAALFSGATHVNMLHTDIFSVPVESVLTFDYFVGAPRDGFGASTGDSTFSEFSFYYLTNGVEFTFSVFGQNPLSFNVSLNDFSAVLGDSNKNLEEGNNFFFAVGAVYGAESYGVMGDNNYYMLDLDDIRVQPIGQSLPGVPTSVPEPSTYGLIAGAFLALAIGYRRYKAKNYVAA